MNRNSGGPSLLRSLRGGGCAFEVIFYQLTAIGAAAPNLHVAQEIANHQFSIAGGAAGMKVSWQVTGVRHDAYAKAHPLVVEVAKSKKERGHYLHPDAFGAPRLTQEQMLQARSKR